MDDSSFDNLIRKKMENYESSVFNPDTFSQLQTRLAEGLTVPWYIKYRTVSLVAATLLLFTLYNIYWVSPKLNLNEKEQTVVLHQSSKVIDSLNSIIKELTNKTPAKIYIIDPANNLTREKKESNGDAFTPRFKFDGTTQNSNLKLFLGSEVDLPREVFNKLKEWNMIALDGDEAWLVISYKKPEDYLVHNKGFDPGLVGVQKPISPVEITIKLEPSSVHSKSNHEISGKMRNSIEKHYFSGIGINLAPHVDLLSGNFTIGSGSLFPRIGLVADWVMSPHFSIETGADYATPKFTVNNNFQRLTLPNVDNQIGSLQSADLGVRTVSLPVNFKFRRWLTAKNQLVYRIGYTPYFAFRHQYVYHYSLPNQTPESDLTISTMEQIDEKIFYGSTLTASVGITRELRDNKKLEASLFFENSLGTMGAEKVGIKLFGIKAAYWFKVK